MQTVGFVGLGRMGGPMVQHLLDDGFSVIVNDINEDAVSTATAAGATATRELADLANAADVVLLSVPGPSVVETVVDGLAPGFDGGETLIDHTTSKPGTTAGIAATLADRSVTVLGAPVSGGQSGAEAGTLSVMVGGDEAILEAYRSVIDAYAATVFHVSDRPEHAHALKLLNNYLSITALVATSEAVLVGEQIGLDIETMVDVFTASTGRNSSTDDKFPNQVVTGNFNTGFAMELVDKDIRLFAEFAEDTETRAIVGDVVRNLVGYARTDLGGDADMTEIYRFVAEHARPPDR